MYFLVYSRFQKEDIWGPVPDTDTVMQSATSVCWRDEIEKASDALWQLLLGILDKATLTLGDNRSVDLSRCIIIMTSNLGAREISSLAKSVSDSHKS